MIRAHRGMIVSVAILVVLALAAFVLTSPQGQGFLDVYGSGGLSAVPGLSGQYSQSGFGMPR